MPRSPRPHMGPEGCGGHPQPCPVSDEAWEEAARRYSERQLAALLVSITNINVWNCLMVASGQLSGEWVEQVIQGTYRA